MGQWQHSLFVLTRDRTDHTSLFSCHPTFCIFLAMFSALWNFFFPPEHIPDPPPLQRPRKYPCTTDMQHPNLNNPHHDIRGKASLNTVQNWPHYYPPQYLQPLSQSQLPYQPAPFETQPNFNMYYNPMPQPGTTQCKIPYIVPQMNP